MVTFRQGRLSSSDEFFKVIRRNTEGGGSLHTYMVPYNYTGFKFKIRVVLALSTEMKKYIYDEYLNILKIGIQLKHTLADTIKIFFKALFWLQIRNPKKSGLFYENISNKLEEAFVII